MFIGVPKEIKAQEYRVGLTPAAVRELAAGEEPAAPDDPRAKLLAAAVQTLEALAELAGRDGVALPAALVDRAAAALAALRGAGDESE